jgi:hypothetical protein
MVTVLEKPSSKNNKSDFRKGYSSRSFDLEATTKLDKGGKKINHDELNPNSDTRRRRRSESINSRIIDDYLREENKKELNKKEFEEAYQKVYGTNASPRSTTSLLSDCSVVKWPCGDYTEAARFFL